MKVSLDWLRELTDLPASLAELEGLLARAGLTVESTTALGVDIPKVVIAQILESAPHPNADRLSVCRVDDGSGAPRQIVCGAKNYRVGDKVPLAVPGAVLPGDFKIKVGKLRGVESEGMLCSAKELQLAGDAEGLLILPPDAPVGRPLAELFPADTVLELEVTPNRPDWLGHAGVAREIAAFTGSALRAPQAPSIVAREGAAARVEDAAGCPFYSLLAIRGVRTGPSPDWMRRRLEAAGLRPINNVVDITNYVLLETGQPLHAFDAARVRGAVAVRRARAGESLEALDGRTYPLAGTELVIADETGPLALAGIVGGQPSGVTEHTTGLLLESAFFDPALIRRTSRALGLSTDSSYRFERGVDPAGVLPAAARAAALLAELAGGVPDGFATTCGEPPPLRPPIPLRFERVRALLGLAIEDAEIRGALDSLGLTETPQGWQAPGFRRDLEREADLIEEVARRIGIERVPSRLVAVPAPASPADRFADFASSLRSGLLARGFSEARSQTLVSADLAGERPDLVRLRNPLGQDQAILRPSIVPSLLEALRRNLHAGQRAVRLFEIGKVYRNTGIEERPCLAIVCCAPAHPPTWRAGGNTRPADFFDLKGLLEDAIGCTFEPAQPDDLSALKATIHCGGRLAGSIGQLHPARQRLLDAPQAVTIAEIELAGLDSPPLAFYSPVPTFPSSSRDIAVVAPNDLPFAAILDEILAAKEPLLTAASPFDLFHDPSGQRLPAHSKSLAISLTFAAPDRTLQTAEINDATARIKARLHETLGVSFRE